MLKVIKDKYKVNQYQDILLNNKIIIVCELNSSNFRGLKTLKVALKKDEFSLKLIKNSLFRKQFLSVTFDRLINGPIFLLYKSSIGEDLKFLQSLIGYPFILGYFFKEKFYNFSVAKKFKKISLTQFYLKVLFYTSSVLSLKFPRKWADSMFKNLIQETILLRWAQRPIVKDAWPSLGALFTLYGSVIMWFIFFPWGGFLLACGASIIILIMTIWWLDIIRGNSFEGNQSSKVEEGMGFSLFIISVILCSVVFYWAFLNLSIQSSIENSVAAFCEVSTESSSGLYSPIESKALEKPGWVSWYYAKRVALVLGLVLCAGYVKHSYDIEMSNIDCQFAERLMGKDEALTSSIVALRRLNKRLGAAKGDAAETEYLTKLAEKACEVFFAAKEAAGF